MHTHELLPVGPVRDLTITITGQMRVVSEWTALVSIPPVDTDTPGMQFLDPAAVATDEVSATLVITIPAPAAAPIFGLALVAARRHRPLR